MAQPGRQSIKIFNGALDEMKLGGEDVIVMRGVVDPDSLRLLNVPAYQRETLSDAKIQRLVRALQSSRVPDIDLGMRGERYVERDGIFYLQDPVFLIDGLQRTTAAMRLLSFDPSASVHLGALIHFATTEEWERARFEDLNLGQTKLSPNVTLRNQRHNYRSAELLGDLAVSAGFPLHDRITWTQSAKRGELITATTFFGIAGVLHSHIGPGRYNNVIELCKGLDRIIDRIDNNHNGQGAEVFVTNVLEFFNQVDLCWGVRQVAYREGAVYLRASFLRALALFFSRHLNFWKEGRLVIDTPTRKKLASFPVQDPNIRSLSASSGSATDMLYHLLTNHVNKGRRTGHLKPRVAGLAQVAELEVEDGE